MYEFFWGCFDCSLRSDLGFPVLVAFDHDLSVLQDSVKLSGSMILTKIYYYDVFDHDLILESSDMCWRRSTAYQFII